MMKHAGIYVSVRGSLSRGWLALARAALLSGLWCSSASAQEASPSKASCAQAYESAQESRAAGQLQETRRRLSFCARAECPSFVQKDCARWLGEVERELPSIVVHAVGLDAAAAAQTRVKIDGQPVADALTGTPIVLDPGRHELIIERPGQAPVSRSIMAQQGVQSRAITIHLDGTGDGDGAGEPLQVDSASTPASLRPYAYAAWGVGAVGLGVFAVLGTLGRADERSLKEDCLRVIDVGEPTEPGTCLQTAAEERESKYKREFLIADIGLITGIVGAAAGTVLFLLSPSGPPEADDVNAALAAPRFRVDVGPTPGGAFATFEGAF